MVMTTVEMVVEASVVEVVVVAIAITLVEIEALLLAGSKIGLAEATVVGRGVEMIDEMI